MKGSKLTSLHSSGFQSMNQTKASLIESKDTKSKK